MEDKYVFINNGDCLIRVNPLSGLAWKAVTSDRIPEWKQIKEPKEDKQELLIEEN